MGYYLVHVMWEDEEEKEGTLASCMVLKGLSGSIAKDTALQIYRKNSRKDRKIISVNVIETTEKLAGYLMNVSYLEMIFSAP
jgi:hypothetical protein